MLLTYSSLISAADSGASRLQQLVDWCKPNFEGLIVFDGMPRSFSTASFDTQHATWKDRVGKTQQDKGGAQLEDQADRENQLIGILHCCRVPQGEEPGARERRQADQGGREGAAAAAHAPARACRLLLRHR